MKSKPSKQWAKSSRYRAASRKAYTTKNKARFLLLLTNRAFKWTKFQMMEAQIGISMGDCILKRLSARSPFDELIKKGRFPKELGETISVITHERIAA